MEEQFASRIRIKMALEDLYSYQRVIGQYQELFSQSPWKGRRSWSRKEMERALGSHLL
jgi:hypothetical protein